MRPPTAFSSAFIGDIASVEVVDSSERYGLKGELGRGGMGVVYLAHDRLLGRDVAFKRPRSDLPAQVRDQVLREAALTASLPHPGVVPVLDAGEDDEGFYYTMPVLTGKSLREFAPDSSVEGLVQVLIQVCNAMGFAHARGVVHRDLKPSNLLVGEHGAVRVLDWGVALDPSSPSHGPVGTEGYAPPEQQAGKPIDATADVYALGRTLASCVSEPPDELRSIIRRATEERAALRYPDAGALGLELEAWLRGSRVQAHEYRVGQLLGRWMVQRWVPLTIAAVGLLAVGITAVAGAASRLSEFQRAEEALASSLALRAADERARGLRFEAERLAAQALVHIENPVARGVLLQWDGEYEAHMLREWEPPCGGQLTSEAYVCQTESIVEAWRDQKRVAVSQIPDFEAGEIRSVEWHEATGFVYFSTSGRIRSDVADIEQFGVTALGPFLYREPYSPSAFRLTEPGKLLVECPNRFDASDATADGSAVVACGDGGIWISDGGEARKSEVFEDVSAVKIDGDDVFVGTHDSRFGRIGMAGASAVDWRVSEGGAPIQFVAGEDWVSVRSERGVVHIYRRDSLALIDRLPGDYTGMSRVGEELHLKSGRGLLSAWSVKPSSPPTVFEFAENGGISAFHVDSTGGRMLVGHATGRVHLVDTSTGSRMMLEDRSNHVVKNALFVGDDLFVQSKDNNRRIHPDGSSTPVDQYWWNSTRAAFGDEAWFSNGGGTYSLDHGHMDWPTLLLVAGPDGVYRFHDGVVSPVREQHGGVTVGGAQYIAVTESAIYTVMADTLRRFDRQGNPSWSVDLPFSRGIRVAADESWVAVGSLSGGLALLDPETGQSVAVVPNAHTRRIAGLQLVGDRLFSSSWDGYVRVWSLQNVGLSSEVVVANLPTVSPRLR